MAKFVRLDVMSGNKDNTQVKSAMYYDGSDAPAAVENGTIVAIGGLLDGERELHKVVDATGTDAYVGIVTTPEVECDEKGYHGIDTFDNVLNRVIHRVFTGFNGKTLVSHILKCNYFFSDFILC